MKSTAPKTQVKHSRQPKLNQPYQLDLFSDYVHETESEYFDQKLQVELRSMFPMNKSYNEDN